MSADILRRAAALMRERAEAATGGPWRFEPEGDSQCGEPACCSDYWENRIWGGGVVIAESHLISGPDAEHIASWHPTVALAVADWLDAEADEFDRYMARQIDPERRFTSIWLDSARARHKHALTVARAYLGETP